MHMHSSAMHVVHILTLHHIASILDQVAAATPVATAKGNNVEGRPLMNVKYKQTAPVARFKFV